MKTKIFLSLLLILSASAAFSQENEQGASESSWLHNKAERMATFRNSQRPIETRQPEVKAPETSWITDKSARSAALSRASAPKGRVVESSRTSEELASSSAAKASEEKPAPPSLESLLPPGALQQIRMSTGNKDGNGQPQVKK